MPKRDSLETPWMDSALLFLGPSECLEVRRRPALISSTSRKSSAARAAALTWGSGSRFSAPISASMTGTLACRPKVSSAPMMIALCRDEAAFGRAAASGPTAKGPISVQRQGSPLHDGRVIVAQERDQPADGPLDRNDGPVDLVQLRLLPPCYGHVLSLSTSRAYASGAISVPSSRRLRLACIWAIRCWNSASSARSSLTELGPFWRALPLAATRALPSGVRGPVERSHGRVASAAWRSRSSPSGVKPFHFFRFRRPASTLQRVRRCGAALHGRPPRAHLPVL